MNFINLYQHTVSPPIQAPSQPVAPTPAPAQEPKEQVQLGASPTPQSKDFKWVDNTAEKPKESPATEDHLKTPSQPPKDPSSLHSKIPVFDHDPLPPPAHVPDSWLKDTGMPNAYYNSESKSLIFQEDVVQREAPAGKTFSELLNEISHITTQAAEGKAGAAADQAATKALESMAKDDLKACEVIQKEMSEASKAHAAQALKMIGGLAGSMLGTAIGGIGGMGMMGMGMMGSNMIGMGGLLGGAMLGAGLNSGPGLGAGFKKPAEVDAELEAWLKAPIPGLHQKTLTLNEMQPGGKAPTGDAEFAAWMSAPAPSLSTDALNTPGGPTATASVNAVQAASQTLAQTPAQRAAEIKNACTDKLREMGESAYFKVDKELLPLLDKMKMDPVDFFTARACWQGVTSKRRSVLEKVLDQFPQLPKDQKNADAALAAVEANGTQLKETDRFFVKYFLEHRKEMKTLFRATLNLFEGDKVTVYRGQSDSSKYAKDATKPLGCYSFNPSQSAQWGSNLKRFKVKLNDVWSTSVVSQNENRSEEEVTVYSRGGVRKGAKIATSEVEAEAKKFKENHHPNLYMKVAKPY